MNNGDQYSIDHCRTAGHMTGDTSSPVPSLSSTSFCISPTPSSENRDMKPNRNKLKNQNHRTTTSNFAYRVRDHVKMGPKLSETLKGKLRLGAKIIKKGGRENIFKEVFGKNDGEKLLKASQCYLSTSAGPIAGILFISTQKLAFCSETPIKLHSSNGDLIRNPYKVSIPTNKIKESNERENVENPARKYIQIVTDDNFEFWFMGFVRYEKAFENLRKVVSK